MRDGQVRQITVQIDMPFGFQMPHTYRVQPLDLRPGDRLVMLTDGMLERNADSVDLPDLIVRTRALHPREAARTSSPPSSTPTKATWKTTRPSCAWTGTAPTGPGGTPTRAPTSPSPPPPHGQDGPHPGDEPDRLTNCFARSGARGPLCRRSWVHRAHLAGPRRSHGRADGLERGLAELLDGLVGELQEVPQPEGEGLVEVAGLDGLLEGGEGVAADGAAQRYRGLVEAERRGGLVQGVGEGDQSAVGVAEQDRVRAGEVEDGGDVVGLPLDGVPTERSPRRHSSTISALSSGVNERRGRGFFFPMLSMMDILPGLNP